MSNPAQREASKRDADHGLRDIEALFIVLHETVPVGHPTESALDASAFWQHLEPGLLVGSADDFEDEVSVSGGIHHACVVIPASPNLGGNADKGTLAEIATSRSVRVAKI